MVKEAGGTPPKRVNTESGQVLALRNVSVGVFANSKVEGYPQVVQQRHVFWKDSEVDHAYTRGKEVRLGQFTCESQRKSACSLWIVIERRFCNCRIQCTSRAPRTRLMRRSSTQLVLVPIQRCVPRTARPQPRREQTSLANGRQPTRRL